MEQQRVYLAIDLKSFYASVECVDRGLDPLSTNLVVADASRTEKTICLAVSPSLKAYRIPGRARLFEVVQRTKEVNAQRLPPAPGRAPGKWQLRLSGVVVGCRPPECGPLPPAGLHRCAAPDGPVSAGVGADQQNLSALCGP